jgi:hypothetical protein
LYLGKQGKCRRQLFCTRNYGLLLARNLIDELQTLSLGSGDCLATLGYS